MTISPFPTPRQFSAHEPAQKPKQSHPPLPAFPQQPESSKPANPWLRTYLKSNPLPSYPHGRVAPTPSIAPPTSSRSPVADSPQKAEPEATATPFKIAPQNKDQELKNIITECVADSLPTTDPLSTVTLEPLLRNIVRRTLAEQIPNQNSSQFSHFNWRIQALLSSRSFDDIVFEKTRRYRIEEVYLFERRDTVLLSYASRNPARHAGLSRVKGTLESLRKLLKDNPKNDGAPFSLPNGEFALVRKTPETVIVVISNGTPNHSAFADIDFIQNRADQHFHANRNNVDLLKFLQPTLENILLIQSPPIPS